MALFQPTNITPSSMAGLGNGVVDVTQGITVKWQINGASAMTKYRIFIYQNTTTSTQVYDSTIISLATPVYGTDYNGDVQFYSVSIPASALTGLANGYSYGYKLKIQQWWSESDSITQTQLSYFTARTAPTLGLTALPSPVTSRNYTFSAAYAQTQGDVINWFRWYLADATQGGDLLADSGEIYGTGDIRFTYNGFPPSGEYAVKCDCQTESGQTATTGWVTFTVQYAVSSVTGSVTACAAAGHNALRVAFPYLAYIPGTGSGYTITGGVCAIASGGYLNWTQVNGAGMSFPRPTTAVWNGTPTYGATVLTLTDGTDSMTLTIESATATLALDGVALAAIDHTVPAGTAWQAVISPAEMYLSAGAWSATTDLTYTQFGIAGVTISGAQSCTGLWIFSGSPESVSAVGSITYNPDTVFLCEFANGLNAGCVIDAGESITGAAIYRQEQGGTPVFVYQTDLTVTELLDYAPKNQSTYRYLVFPLGATSYVGAALVSGYVQAFRWDYSLILSEADDGGVYHVTAEYLFKLNVSTGAMSNNNKPNPLVNFTQYPKIQLVSTNYKSGSLAAYIGRVDFTANEYVDTTALADEIFSVSSSAAVKFLKDRKGNVLMVQTSDAITMQTGDNQAPQPYAAAIPWSETGSTAGVSVIMTPDDDAWNK